MVPSILSSLYCGLVHTHSTHVTSKAFIAWSGVGWTTQQRYTP